MGQKDFQQLYLIKKYLLKKYKIKIYSCKTVRDNFQVALSTRNFLLSENSSWITGQIIGVDGGRAAVV